MKSPMKWMIRCCRFCQCTSISMSRSKLKLMCIGILTQHQHVGSSHVHFWPLLHYRW
jgi:hypothetical protein